jgi:hypothetical protein
LIIAPTTVYPPTHIGSIIVLTRVNVAILTRKDLMLNAFIILLIPERLSFFITSMGLRI